MKKIAITGGHLTPALAVIEKLKKEGNWQIFFIGRKQTMEGDRAPSIESQIIPKLGIDFLSIKAGRIQRGFNRYFFPALFKIPLGFCQSFCYLLKFHPDVILSFGGYLAVPVVLSGWLFGTPIITHEQSVIPGLATRFISLLAKKIAVSWKETLRYLPKTKTVLTGNPIREEILKISKLKTQNLKLKTIYITGGNQGAHVINETVRECLPELLKKYKIIHQCGTVEYYKDYKKLKIKSEKLKTGLRKRYRLAKWFNSEEVAEILALADLVVSRAGANIISELALLGKPAILIPLPWGGEQRNNARILADTGLGKILPQKELTARNLLQAIESLIGNLQDYQKKGKIAKKLIETDGTRRLIVEVKKCLKVDRKNIFS